MSSIPQRLEQETTVAQAASTAPVVLKRIPCWAITFSYSKFA